MSSNYKEQLAEGLIALGKYLQQPDLALTAVKHAAVAKNSWFTDAEVDKAIGALADMLNEQDLRLWVSELQVTDKVQRVGLILAGNIPLVGFHDVLCVLASGHQAYIKMSSSDDQLLPFILQKLSSFLPMLAEQIIFVDKLSGFDAVIATGSNNSARYFEYYFGKVPHIIRKNRNSVAILDGTESQEEIHQLGFDIFDYFGMGCRNVSKIYLPEGYEIKNLFEPLEHFQAIINHHKYRNNYDYQKSIYLVNRVTHFDNGFLLLKEDKALASPLGVLHYEYYNDKAVLLQELAKRADEIQCVVAKTGFEPDLTLAFGQSQHPKLWDYADKVNTLAFLQTLNN